MSANPSANPKQRRASIGDVARLAGVSPQTVSRVSTGAESVSPGTRGKVLEAMELLGYTPNHAARALRGGRFSSIGVLTQRVERTGEGLIVAGIVETAATHGYSVTLVQVEKDYRGALHSLTNAAIDGLLIVQAGPLTPETLVIPPGVPAVSSEARFMGFCPTVTIDQVGGTRQAVQLLLDQGHQNVHTVSGPVESVPAAIRTGTWRRTLALAGISAPEPLVGDWTADSGYEAGRILAKDPSVTAIFAGNDEMAFGVLRALHEAGRKVPEDVSVVGFDGIELANYSYPPLTTVAQDFHTIGLKLVEVLLQRIENPSAPSTQGDLLIPGQLIERETVGPVRSNIRAK